MECNISFSPKFAKLLLKQAQLHYKLYHIETRLTTLRRASNYGLVYYFMNKAEFVKSNSYTWQTANLIKYGSSEFVMK